MGIWGDNFQRNLYQTGSLDHSYADVGGYTSAFREECLAGDSWQPSLPVEDAPAPLIFRPFLFRYSNPDCAVGSYGKAG